MISIFVILFGLCFGSFLNVLIIRAPMNKSVILPSSSCMHCGRKLKPHHNIPVFSYFFLGGKCGFCKSRISPMYPLVESSSGLICYLLYLKFDFSYSLIFISISILLLFALSVIDYRFKEVPDSINFAALVFGIIGAIFNKDFLIVFTNAFSMAGFFTLLRFSLQNILKKETLGEGDIIVVSTMGAIAGAKLALAGIFIASILASIFLIFAKDSKAPFIPFLFLGLLVVLFFDGFFAKIIFDLYRI